MKSRIQKSIIALMLCLTLAGTSSISAIHADASEADNEQVKSGQSVDSDKMNAGGQNVSEETGDQDHIDEEEQEKVSDSSKAEEGESEEQDDTEEQEPVGVEYQAHVQTYGWQKTVKDGELAGTEGEAKRVEAIKMNLVNLPEEYDGSSIEYAVHVQNYGWQNAVSDGAVSGTSGQAKRLEAITVKLSGPIAEDYDVYYRTHVQTYGWLGWAKNGEKAGSAAASKRMEAIEIKLVKHGEDAPENTGAAYKCPLVSYQSHMQSYGWTGTVYDDAVSGVTGKSKRMESLKISLPDAEGTTGYTGGISYQAFVQGIG